MASAGVVLWQNSRLTLLWDVNYIVENAVRIAAGDVPYRDFPFPYAPLTFVVQAAIIRLFGRAWWHHVAYAALAGGAATALTYVIVRRFVPRATALCLTLPLALLGIYCIVPNPFYDPDACLAVVAVIAALLRFMAPLPARGERVAEGRVRGATRDSLVVALAVVPLFVKQNIGLAFVVALVLLLIIERRWRALAGVAIGALAAFVLVAAIFGVGNYVTWTIQYAAARRLPPIGMMLGVYRDPLVWWAIAIVVLSLVHRHLRWLLAVPWLFVVVRFFVSDDPNEREINLLRVWPVMLVVATLVAVALWRREEPLLRAIPLLAVATIHGTFLSQATWGSTYGIWPLLVILLAFVFRAAKAPPWIAAIVAVATLLSAGHYLRTEGRLAYAKWSEGEMRTSTLPALRGMHVRGEWLPDLEELVAWTDAHVPRDDGIFFIPGEDPFFFATGRRPRMPVVMLDPTVNPYTPAQLAAIAAQRARWVIVKRRLQVNGTPYPQLGDLIHLLSERYRPVAFLRNYIVWSDRPLP